MGDAARAVTPLLAVGTFGSTSREHEYHTDPRTAAQRIARGVLVLVPDDGAARIVLTRLGVSHDVIDERIQFSHSGRTGSSI